MGEFLHPDQNITTSPQLSKDEAQALYSGRIIPELGRISRFSWFSPQTEIDREFAEFQAHSLLAGIQLPERSIIFIEDLEEAKRFAELVDHHDEWSIAWDKKKELARKTSAESGFPVHNLWFRISEATNITSVLGPLFGDKPLGKDAARRSSAFLQGITVEKTLGGNPLAPFIDMYETGGALLGTTNEGFGIYVPPVRK